MITHHPLSIQGFSEILSKAFSGVAFTVKYSTSSEKCFTFIYILVALWGAVGEV